MLFVFLKFAGNPHIEEIDAKGDTERIYKADESIFPGNGLIFSNSLQNKNRWYYNPYDGAQNEYLQEKAYFFILKKHTVKYNLKGDPVLHHGKNS